jgi:hypothetical protein
MSAGENKKEIIPKATLIKELVYFVTSVDA